MATLTARTVTTLTKPGRYADGDNLYLQIGPAGTKSWAFVFMRDGRSRQMGLGVARIGARTKGLTLAEARDEAAKVHVLLRQGVDPIEHRNASKPLPPAIPTFRDFAESWITDNEARWRNAKSAPQWRASLRDHAYEHVGELRLDQITTGHVLTTLKPIWTTKAETARKVRTRIMQILDAAKALGYRSGDNPAGWRGNLKDLLPKRSRAIEHHAALPFAKVPAFIKRLRKMPGMASLAFEFLILTWARTGEVIGAKWNEIDLKARTWLVPGERMKSGRPHLVPLSDRAVAILKSLPREGDYVFPGRWHGAPLSNMAFLALLKRMEMTDITAHGFRSAARDWAGETTTHQREVIEMALAHAVGDETERAYARGTMFEKRVALMREWAKFAVAK